MGWGGEHLLAHARSTLFHKVTFPVASNVHKKETGCANLKPVFLRPQNRLCVTPELVLGHMGGPRVPSSLPPQCIGKDKLGLNPSALTSASPKSGLSPLALREVSVEVITFRPTTWKVKRMFATLPQLPLPEVGLARGARPASALPWLPGDSFPRK